MQLSPLSFIANLPQPQSENITLRMASTPLTASKLDTFTPSTQIRYGKIEDSLEQKFAQFIAERTPLLDHLVPSTTSAETMPFAEALEKAWEESQIMEAYHRLFGTDDEVF
jgi:hypothetical protein